MADLSACYYSRSQSGLLTFTVSSKRPHRFTEPFCENMRNSGKKMCHGVALSWISMVCNPIMLLPGVAKGYLLLILDLRVHLTHTQRQIHVHTRVIHLI